MNLPGVIVDLPTLTDKDKEDLTQWGVKNNIDFIAASFVRKGADLDNIRAVLGEEGAGIHIISKIENQEGIQNFETVLEKSDGIMVCASHLVVLHSAGSPRDIPCSEHSLVDPQSCFKVVLCCFCAVVDVHKRRAGEQQHHCQNGGMW